jgi:hypothetical protein
MPSRYLKKMDEPRDRRRRHIDPDTWNRLWVAWRRDGVPISTLAARFKIDRGVLSRLLRTGTSGGPP